MTCLAYQLYFTMWGGIPLVNSQGAPSLCCYAQSWVAGLVRMPGNAILLHYKLMLKHGQSGRNCTFYFSYCGHVKHHKLNSTAACQLVGDYGELFLNLSLRVWESLSLSLSQAGYVKQNSFIARISFLLYYFLNGHLTCKVYRPILGH